MVSLIFILYLINPHLQIRWGGYKHLKGFYKKGKILKNPILGPKYIGPEGGIIFYPVSSEYKVKKVLAPSLFDYHKCENVFAGDTFEIVIPYGMNLISFKKPGVMTGPNTSLLIRDSISYYFTSDNFITVDTVFFSSELSAIDARGDTVYMIVGDSLLRSTNGGGTFNFIFDIEDFIGPGNYDYLIDVFPFNSNIISIYVSTGNFGYFLYSSNGGVSFTKDSLPYNEVISLRFLHLNPNYIFLVTFDTGVVYTPDAGATWNVAQINYTFSLPAYPVFGFDILPFHPDTFLFSSIADRGIYKVFYDQILNGWFYSIVDTNLIPFFFEPVYKNGSLYDTFYVGSNDGIYYTTDKGKNWVRYKNRLKAVILQGPSQVCSRKDTSFIITGGGVVYRSFDILNTGFEELSFKGNLMFFGNNMIDNFYNSPSNLYLITPKIRVLDPSFYRVLFYSSNAGNSFILRNSNYELSLFEDIIPGSNVNAFYLWNEDSIIKTTTSGSSFLTIMKTLDNIGHMDGEGDTFFILKKNDSLYASFDGGNSFSFLDLLPNANTGGKIYYVKGSKYVFFIDTIANNLMYYNITSSFVDVAIEAPSSSHILIDISPSYDNYIYALFYDTLNTIYEIYYRAMPNGNLMSAPVSGLEKPVGIVALNNGFLLIYEMGRGAYLMGVTSINEAFREKSGILYVPSFVIGDFLEIKGIKDKISYSIFDISGRKILKGFISSPEERINLKFFKKGIYYMKIEKGIYKFIKF